MIFDKKIKADYIIISSVIMSYLIFYSYAKSFTIFYGGVELIVAAICYYSYVMYFKKIDFSMRYMCLIVIVIAFFMGTVNFNLKSTLLITTSLVIPLFISVLEINYMYIEKSFVVVTIFSILIIYFQNKIQYFENFNSNSIGFMGFMGISWGFIWLNIAKNKIIPIIVLIIGMINVAYTGSRNVAIISLLCSLMLFVPKNVILNRKFYISICGMILLYSIFSAKIMELGFSMEYVNKSINNYTEVFSQKKWTME